MVSVMLYPCTLCVALLMYLFVLCVACVPKITFHIVVASSPTFALQSSCTMSISFFTTCSVTFCICFFVAVV